MKMLVSLSKPFLQEQESRGVGRCHPKAATSSHGVFHRCPFLKAAQVRGDSRLPAGILTWDFPREGELQCSFHVRGRERRPAGNLEGHRSILLWKLDVLLGARMQIYVFIVW